ncbi:hypothetical protein CD114_06245, partial [Mammaliicoccus sciuri]
SLAYYYSENDKDLSIVRKYFNLSYFVNVSDNLSHNFISRSLEDNEYYQLRPNYRITEFYESMLFVHTVSENSLVEFFISDVNDFYETDTEFCEILAKYLISFTKKDNNAKAIYAEQLLSYGKQAHYSYDFNDIFENNGTHIENNQDDNIKVQEQNKNLEDTNPNNSVKDTLWGCGCLLFIVLAIAGCSAVIF